MRGSCWKKGLGLIHSQTHHDFLNRHSGKSCTLNAFEVSCTLIPSLFLFLFCFVFAFEEDRGPQWTTITFQEGETINANTWGFTSRSLVSNYRINAYFLSQLERVPWFSVSLSHLCDVSHTSCSQWGASKRCWMWTWSLKSSPSWLSHCPCRRELTNCTVCPVNP